MDNHDILKNQKFQRDAERELSQIDKAIEIREKELATLREQRVEAAANVETYKVLLAGKVYKGNT